MKRLFEVLNKGSEIEIANDNFNSSKENLESAKSDIKAVNDNIESIVETDITEKLSNAKGKIDSSINEMRTFRYKVISTLGSGGFGVVYVVEEISDNGGNKRIIKTFNPQLNKNEDEIRILRNKFLDKINENDSENESENNSENDSLIERNYNEFKGSPTKEIKCGGSANINIKEVKMNIEDKKTISVLISDPLDAINLREYLDNNKDTVSFQKIVEIAKNVLSFTDNMRKKRAVHFDIKPDNILINRTTGNVIGFIDYSSAFIFDSMDENNIEEYKNFHPGISFGELDLIRDDATIERIKNLKYCFDIFCSVKWFLDKLKDREYSRQISGLEKLNKIDSIKRFCSEIQINKRFDDSVTDNEIIEFCDSISKEFHEILDSIKTLDWAGIKTYCKEKYRYDDDLSLAKIVHDSIEVPEKPGTQIDSLIKGKKPILIECDFYEERKEICNELAKALSDPEKQTKGLEIIAVPFTLNLNMNSMYDIKKEIALAISGQTDFSLLYDLLTKLYGKKIVLIVNIRTYNKESIDNLIECVAKELIVSTAIYQDGFDVFNFIIVAGEIHTRSKMSGEFVKLDLSDKIKNKTISGKSPHIAAYNFNKLNEQIRNLANENKQDIAHKLANTVYGNESGQETDSFVLKRINSLYHLRMYMLEKDSNPIAPLSAFQLIISSLQSLSTEKATAFVLMLYSAFPSSGLANGSKAMVYKGKNYHSPLREEDIILIAERTGIISILGRGKTGEAIYIKILNSVMIDELYANAVFEQYISVTASEYEKRILKNPINEYVYDSLCNSAEGSIEEKISKNLNNRDPVYKKWNYGYAKTKAELSEEETYTAINLRLLLTVNSRKRYTEPQKNTGHYVILNENAKNAYYDQSPQGSEWRRKIDTVINGIEKNQVEKKWIIKTKEKRRNNIIYISSLVTILLIASIWIICLYLNNLPKSIEFTDDVNLSFSRKVDLIESVRIEPDKTTNTVLYDDNIFIPLNNSTLTSDRCNAFYFVSQNGKQYKAKPIDQNGKIIPKSPVNGINLIRCSSNDSETEYHALRLQFSTELNNEEYPVHIKEICNEKDKDKMECDFYAVGEKYKINVSVEQLPAITNKSMEFYLTFSSQSSFSVEDDLYEYIFLYDGNGNCVSASKSSIISQSDKEQKYKVRFDKIDESSVALVDDEASKSLYVSVYHQAAYIKYDNKKLYTLNVPNLHNHFIDSNCFVSLVASENDINADLFDSGLEYTTKSASNAKNIIFEPKENITNQNASIINAKKPVSNILYDNFSNSNCFLIIKNVQQIEKNSSIVLNAALSNGNKQYTSFKAQISNLEEILAKNYTDIKGPKIEFVDYSFNDDSINLRLLETDNYPLAGKIDLNVPLENILTVYGISQKYKLSYSFSYVYEFEKGYVSNKQYIDINITDFNYLGDKNTDTSIVIDCSYITDASGCRSDSGLIAAGNDIFFNAPYENTTPLVTDSQYIIEVAYPVGWIQNLTQGHIVSSQEHHIDEYSGASCRKIRFNNIQSSDEVNFTLNEGTTINQKGNLMYEFKYDFSENLLISKCRRFGDVIQAELVFHKDIEAINFNNLIKLLDENGNAVAFSGITRISGNRVILTLSGFSGTPSELVIGKGVGLIRSENKLTGEVRASVQNIEVTPNIGEGEVRPT